MRRERREEASQHARHRVEGGGGPGAHFVLGLRTSAQYPPRPRNVFEACSHAAPRGPASLTPARPRCVALARGVPQPRPPPLKLAAPRATASSPAPASTPNPPGLGPLSNRGSRPSPLPARPSPSWPRWLEPPHPSRPRVRPRPSDQHLQPQPALPEWTVPPGKQMHKRVPLAHSLSRMSSGR